MSTGNELYAEPSRLDMRLQVCPRDSNLGVQGSVRVGAKRKLVLKYELLAFPLMKHTIEHITDWRITNLYIHCSCTCIYNTQSSYFIYSTWIACSRRLIMNRGSSSRQVHAIIYRFPSILVLEINFRLIFQENTQKTVHGYGSDLIIKTPI